MLLLMRIFALGSLRIENTDRRSRECSSFALKAALKQLLVHECHYVRILQNSKYSL